MFYGFRDVFINMNQTCTQCKKEKLIHEFQYRKNRNNYYTQCIECRKIKSKKWRETHSEQCIKSGKLWRAKAKIENPLGERARMLNSSIRSHSTAKGQLKEIGTKYIVELYHKQDGKCHYTGIPMKLHSNTLKDFLLMSVDKIDNTKGYVKDNIVLCCWGINLLKGEHSIDTLYKHLTLFYNSCIENGKIPPPDKRNEA